MISLECAICERLDAEFERLERRFAEKRGEHATCELSPRTAGYRAMAQAMNEAWLELEEVRVERMQHRRICPTTAGGIQ
jgi:hypothetical protein